MVKNSVRSCQTVVVIIRFLPNICLSAAAVGNGNPAQRLDLSHVVAIASYMVRTWIPSLDHVRFGVGGDDEGAPLTGPCTQLRMRSARGSKTMCPCSSVARARAHITGAETN